jgi:hypothetical protein
VTDWPQPELNPAYLDGEVTLELVPGLLDGKVFDADPVVLGAPVAPTFNRTIPFASRQ